MVSGYLVIAAMLSGLASWIDSEVSGGAPPKWVAQQAADAARYISHLARLADRGEPLDLDTELTHVPPQQDGPR